MANPFSNSIKFLTAINLLASTQGTTIKRLMEKLNISRRTAFRLLEALQELGLPLIDEQSSPRVEKTYRLMECYVHKLPNMVLPKPGLTTEEIELLFTILDFSSSLQMEGIDTKLNSIKQKLSSLVIKSSIT